MDEIKNRFNIVEHAIPEDEKLVYKQIFVLYDELTMSFKEKDQDGELSITNADGGELSLMEGE